MMMAPPLTSAVPLALAAGAYLNARWKLSHDITTLSSIAFFERHFRKLESQDRINSFYRLEEHASNKAFANETFLIFEDKSWTFKQTYENVLRHAGWLHRKYGVSKGDVVAIDMMNSAHFVFLTIALWSLGATPALINYNLIGKSFLHCLKVSKAKVLIVDPELEPKLLTLETLDAIRTIHTQDNSQPIEVIVLGPDLQTILNYFPPYRAPDSARSVIKRTSAAVFIFTSGTTGLPKPALLPWTRLVISSVFKSLMGLRSVNTKKPDRFYTCMPLYHTTAFALGFHMCLQQAVTLVVGRKFSVTNFWPDVRKSRATAIQYVGETLRYLLIAPVSPDDKTHHVRVAFGNGLRPDVWTRFKSRFGIETISEMYGATEAVSAVWNISRNPLTEGAIGQFGVITDFILRLNQAVVEVDWETEKPIRDANTGFCKRVPRGEVGELIQKVEPDDIDAKFQGYLDNQKATEDKILRNVFAKGDAYYRSGDTVRWDKEGLLWFNDRIGDTFRWKSENVSTSEVGEIMGHHRSVLEANVYGVEVPGHEGRAGCAAILLRDEALEQDQGYLAVKPEVLESLATWNLNSLPKYAVPVFLRVGRNFSMTGTNKQQKHVLRNQGIDVNVIREAGKEDTMYWLRPGTDRYILFKMSDLQGLKQNEVRL